MLSGAQTRMLQNAPIQPFATPVARRCTVEPGSALTVKRYFSAAAVVVGRFFPVHGSMARWVGVCATASVSAIAVSIRSFLLLRSQFVSDDRHTQRGRERNDGEQGDGRE